MTLNASRALALGALVVAGSVLGLSAPAQAHNYLVSSTPADGETLTVLPEVFEITTNGALLSLNGATEGFAMEVVDSEGLYYGDGCVTVDGASMSEKAALGEPGEYTLLWQVVSGDGHPISGELDFTWSPSGDATVTQGTTAPARCGADTDAPATPATPTEQRGDANLGDVLWIGGAIGAVLLAALVTFLVIARRSKQP